MVCYLEYWTSTKYTWTLSVFIFSLQTKNNIKWHFMTFDEYLKFVIAGVQWTIKYKCNWLAVLPLWEIQARSTEFSIPQFMLIFHQCLAPDPLSNSLSPLCLNSSTWKIRQKEKVNTCLQNDLNSRYGKSYIKLKDWFINCYLHLFECTTMFCRKIAERLM